MLQIDSSGPWFKGSLQLAASTAYHKLPLCQGGQGGRSRLHPFPFPFFLRRSCHESPTRSAAPRPEQAWPGAVPVSADQLAASVAVVNLEAQPTAIGVGIDTSRYGHHATFLRADLQPAAEDLDFAESAAGRHAAVHFHFRLDVAYADNLLAFLQRLSWTKTISCGDPQRNKNYRSALTATRSPSTTPPGRLLRHLPGRGGQRRGSRRQAACSQALGHVCARQRPRAPLSLHRCSDRVFKGDNTSPGGRFGQASIDVGQGRVHGFLHITVFEWM